MAALTSKSPEQQPNYDYLKRWLSRDYLIKVRNGNNPLGIKLSRQQVHNIMKGTSKNFAFRNMLVRQAIENERLYTITNFQDVQENLQSKTA